MTDTGRNLSFLGQGWSFPPQFDPATKELALVQEAEDIRQSLYVLFHTEPGERVMQPTYGCALRQFLFEMPVSSTLARLEEEVCNAILHFEPRINVQLVQTDTSDLANGILRLEVNYVIRTLNSRHNIVFPFFLQEATLLPSA